MTAPPQNAPADLDHLDRSFLRGIAWTGAARWSTQIVSWTATYFLARLLTPDDFGVVALGAVYVGFVSLVTEMGLGTAVVTFRDLTDHEMRQINGLALLVGMLGCGVTAAMAVPIGLFFQSDVLPPIVAVMGLTFIVSSLRTVPIGILQREFRFKLIAGFEAMQGVLLAAAQTVFAFAGFRAWSLVLGELTALSAATLVLVAYRHRGFAVPRRASLSRVTTFTANILATRISWYLYSNADFVIVGRVLGVRALGTYRMAWNVSTAPIQKIVEVVTRVTPAVFSAVQRDHAALRRYVLVITEALATVTFPASVGITLVADDLVKVALGPAWLSAILPLRLLAAYVALRTISTIPSQVLTVTGDTEFTMRNGIRALVVMPAAFLIGSFWGSAGVAAAWIVAYPTIIVPVYLRLFRRIELSAGSYLAAVGPATSGTVAMALAVFGVRLLFSEGTAPVARLATQVVVGVAVYAGWVLGVHRGRIARLIEGVRRIRR